MPVKLEIIDRLCRTLSTLIILTYGYITATNIIAAPINRLSEDLEKIAVKARPSIVSIVGVSSDHKATIGTGFLLQKRGIY